jgi:hypothetical protein
MYRKLAKAHCTPLTAVTRKLLAGQMDNFDFFDSTFMSTDRTSNKQALKIKIY